MHHRDAPDAVRKYMYPFPTIAMTKQTFKAEDGSIIHYDTDTKEVRREEPKVVSPLLWRPKHDGGYYFICANGDVISRYDGNTEYEYQQYLMGNSHKTYAIAEQARDKQLATMRVLRRIAELNDGWVPEWEQRENAKFLICYDHRCQYSLFFARPKFCQECSMDWYLKSTKAADSLIASHSDDLKLIFGISKS